MPTWAAPSLSILLAPVTQHLELAARPGLAARLLQQLMALAYVGCRAAKRQSQTAAMRTGKGWWELGNQPNQHLVQVRASGFKLVKGGSCMQLPLLPMAPPQFTSLQLPLSHVPAAPPQSTSQAHAFLVKRGRISALSRRDSIVVLSAPTSATQQRSSSE